MSQYEVSLHSESDLFGYDKEMIFNFGRAERVAIKWSRQFPTMYVKLAELVENGKIVWFRYGRRTKAPLA